MTDVELDERVTALEENGSGVNVNGKMNITTISLFKLDWHWNTCKVKCLKAE